MCGEPQQALRGDEWTVDREYEADVMTRRAQSGDEARDGSAHVGAVVEDRKRERQRVGLLPDGDPLLAGRAQHAPGTLGKRLAPEERQCFRRAEAAARAAHEQNAGQRSMRHCSL